MKKIVFNLSCLFIILLSSCESIDTLQDDPNRVASVTPDLLLTDIEIEAVKNIGTGAGLASRQLTNTDGVSNEQYYNWQRSSFDNYHKLKQVQKMEEEADRYEEEVYKSLAKFFYSYYIVETTLVFGDVPYSEALKIGEGIQQPKYDTQKDIFLRVLEDLAQANELLAESDGVIKGDIIYRGDKLKWRKLINSYTLKVLIDLSNKVGDSDLKIKERFQTLVSNPVQYPIFENLEDSAFLEFVDSKGNQYPYFNDNALQTAYYMEESFVDKLVLLKDTRLFRFAAMKNKRADDELTNFKNYGGLKGSNSMNENSQKAVDGEASRVNTRYYTDPVNEPGVLLSYWSLQFNLAEAAERGWISGSSETYYNQGIESSFKFLKADMPLDYLNQDAVKLNATDNLERIMTQKHIASFMNSGWQSFYDNRRTGFPKFNVDGSGILNQGRIPKRWMYPVAETVNNNKNLSDAVNRQFEGGDTINSVMWLLKP